MSHVVLALEKLSAGQSSQCADMQLATLLS